jgi:predicted amidohydrolase
VSGYQADVVLFPEFFNGPLMAPWNDQGPAEAVRQLAGYTEAIRDQMLKFAVSYNINIIAGSMPEYDGEQPAQRLLPASPRRHLGSPVQGSRHARRGQLLGPEGR